MEKARGHSEQRSDKTIKLCYRILLRDEEEEEEGLKEKCVSLRCTTGPR